MIKYLDTNQKHISMEYTHTPAKFRERGWAKIPPKIMRMFLMMEEIMEEHPKLEFGLVLPKIETFLDAQTKDLARFLTDTHTEGLALEESSLEEKCWKYCAKVCADLAHLNPEWSAVGGEVLLAWVRLCNPFTFSEYTKLGTSPKGISSEYSEFVQRSASTLDAWANRQVQFEYPGACTLVQSYLYKIQVPREGVGLMSPSEQIPKEHQDRYVRETPAMMYLRVATFLHYPDLAQIKELYDVLCEKKASFGSPVYFNAATRRPNMASCFASGMRVMTQEGMIPIEVIKPGQFTLTHTGSWKRISQTHRNPRNGRMMVKLTVETAESCVSINCTHDHEFWAIKNYGKEVEGSWIAAKDLGAGDFLHCPLEEKNTRLGFTTPSGQNFVRILSKASNIDNAPEYVYTLGVEDDHSYCVEGVSAKNCFLSRVSDDMGGISENWKEAALISMNKGGFGVDFSCLRHSEIGVNGGVSRGIIPWAKILNEVMNAVDQGSVRKGSATVYLRDFHVDLEEFIELRKAAGHESMRARDLFLGVVVSDLFWQRVKNDENWSFFCANKCPGLATSWGLEFEKLYLEYEKKGMYSRQCNARDIHKKIYQLQVETGMPFIMSLDNANRKNMQCNIGPIWQSNLCTEIYEHTSDTEIASCTLASLCYPVHILTTAKEKKKVDWNSLAHTTRVMIRALNQIIDRTYYPEELPKIKYANIKNRPIALGEQGVADLFAILNLTWENPKSRRIYYGLQENRYYWAVMQSIELARMYGPYPAYAGSPYSNGLLHTDLADIEGKAKDHPEWSRITSDKWWKLKKECRLIGIRNSLLIAKMPTASTSYLIGHQESSEPFSHLIFTRKLLSGKFIHVNKHLYRDITQYKQELWSDAFVSEIIQSGGSIQHLSIPENITLEQNLKAKYKTVFELPQSLILDFSIDTVRFVDQGSSLNAHFANPCHQDKYSWDIKAWEGGLKTIQYYYRTIPAAPAINFAVGTKIGENKLGSKNAKVVCAEEICTSCSG